MISHVDKTRRLITYDSAAGPGSSGSPVFLLKTEHLPGQSARQTALVVGVHSCSSFLTKLACGVHVRLIAETLRLAQATPTPVIESVEPVIMPIGYENIASRSATQDERKQRVLVSPLAARISPTCGVFPKNPLDRYSMHACVRREFCRRL